MSFTQKAYWTMIGSSRCLRSMMFCSVSWLRLGISRSWESGSVTSDIPKKTKREAAIKTGML